MEHRPNIRLAEIKLQPIMYKQTHNVAMGDHDPFWQASRPGGVNDVKQVIWLIHLLKAAAILCVYSLIPDINNNSVVISD
ncbi:hypothetical protein D3C80_1906240 [compost metagenome]